MCSNESNALGNSEMHSIEGYKKKLSIDIAGNSMVLAENSKANFPYLVFTLACNNLGIEEMGEAVIFDNYLEAIREFINRVDTIVKGLEDERIQRGMAPSTLTVADCVPSGLNEDFTDKVIIIKADVLMPEYRTADYQLKICICGFGTKPNATKTAVFCKDLYSGKEERFERNDILGVAAPEMLPQWAKAKIEILTDKTVFEFGGYHFKPVRKFRSKEVDKKLENDSRPWKKDMAYAMQNMATDMVLGFSTYEWKKYDYSYEKFYEASGGSDADIFRCIENEKLYVPSENELFRYKSK
ncbi:hypothetical protein LJB89_00470 [Tyzzerella sp. OttesenSCG-928-J15]|nr:hypothetical protein [Tyzzerella sp. OttesenSCG-928-J15]